MIYEQPGSVRIEHFLVLLRAFALVASVSASVGFAGSTASGKQPNFIKQAIKSSRAFVAVRLLPAIASGSRLASTKPLVFPLETLTTGMPLNVARLSAASTELLMAPKGAEPSATNPANGAST